MFIGLSGAGGPDWMIGWTWKRQNHWTWDRPNPSLSPIEIKIKHSLGGFGTVTTFNPYMKQP